MKLVKIYISSIIINRGKNNFELVGTVVKGVSFTLWLKEFLSIPLFVNITVPSFIDGTNWGWLPIMKVP